MGIKKMFLVFCVFLVSCFLFLASSFAGDVPATMSYQGFVKSNGIVYNGTGYFKFVIVNSAGTISYWTNDGSSNPSPFEPTFSVATTVTNGVYNIILGDTDIPNMQALDKIMFANGVVLYLRVWFSSDGATFERITTDKELTSSAYAFNAQYAQSVAGGTVAVTNGGTGADTAPGARTSLGLAIGTNVQAWDVDLDTLAGLSKSAGNFIVGDGTNWTVQSAATANDDIPYLTRFGCRAGNANKSGGICNSFFGYQAGLSNTVGEGNTAVGYGALDSNINGNYNVSIGLYSMDDNTIGSGNIAIGRMSLVNNTEGSYNTAIGYHTMYDNITNGYNTAVGANALQNNTAAENTAVGCVAMLLNVAGTNNTAMGHQALYSNISGSSNVAVGNDALYSNISSNNVAVGFQALYSSSTGALQNTAVGMQALYSNTSGTNNTASGIFASYYNTSGSFNVSSGYRALMGTYGSSTGGRNVAVGADALLLNATGQNNVAVGYTSLDSNTTGQSNTAVGSGALWASVSVSNGTAVGVSALGQTTGESNTAMGAIAGWTNTTGTNNTFIGYGSDASSSGLTNATAIGYNAIVGQNNSLVLGGTGSYVVKVGIGTSTPASTLDITSTTGALIVPRMSTAQRDAMSGVNGMIIYNTTTNQFNFYENGAWVTK